MGPPCGTSSRARDIRRAHGPDPKPLRSEKFPNGLPSLKNVDTRRVELANVLYEQCAKTFEFCCREGILTTIENPGNSYFWLTTYQSPFFRGYGYVSLRVDVSKFRMLCFRYLPVMVPISSPKKNINIEPKNSRT